MFARPIAIQSGEVVERDGFVFADVLPAQSGNHQISPNHQITR